LDKLGLKGAETFAYEFQGFVPTTVWFVIAENLFSLSTVDYTPTTAGYHEKKLRILRKANFCKTADRESSRNLPTFWRLTRWQL